MITLKDFYKGRDVTYSKQLTDAIVAQASITVERVNLLLTKYRMETRDYSSRVVTSGWRPPEVNAATENAAKKSNHVLGKACDIADTDGKLDAWLMSPLGTAALEDCSLWHEHPRDTVGWAHVQTVPPGSGKRHFYAK